MKNRWGKILLSPSLITSKSDGGQCDAHPQCRSDDLLAFAQHDVEANELVKCGSRRTEAHTTNPADMLWLSVRLQVEPGKEMAPALLGRIRGARRRRGSERKNRKTVLNIVVTGLASCRKWRRASFQPQGLTVVPQCGDSINCRVQKIAAAKAPHIRLQDSSSL